MLSKEEIDCCKREAKDYIQFMEAAGDNAGWTRLLLAYIEQLEQENTALKKRTIQFNGIKKKMED